MILFWRSKAVGGQARTDDTNEEAESRPSVFHDLAVSIKGRRGNSFPFDWDAQNCRPRGLWLRPLTFIS